MTKLRNTPVNADRDAVRRLVTDTAVFSGIEVGWAVEIVDAALQRGDASGYHLLFADGENGLEGFACFGLIEGTDNRFDLYWIAVSPLAQGKGLGKKLLRACQDGAKAKGATHMFIDTSTRNDYAAARSLYKSEGFELMGMLVDFYSDGDSKALFGRKL
jgi:ribosomal protein S18 acetylase RimI-like enzyme